MAKFNSQVATKRVVNRAGGEAFQQSPKLELVSILLTSFVKDQYYRGQDKTIQRVIDLIGAMPDKKFPAKAAIFARNEFGMRSISHVVAGTIAQTVKGEQWLKSFYEKVVRRPDDMAEILAFYMRDGEKPVPNAIKKGFASALGKFDEYQLAKYRGEGKDISLVDIVNLIHPKPTAKNQVALEKLIKGELKSVDTWENKLSEAGKAESAEQVSEKKADAWRDLIHTRKIGYFALLRNLRNILEQAPEMVSSACELLVDEKLIQKSLVLPFRFTTAYEELKSVQAEGVRDVIVALNHALDLSCKNVPVFPGKTLVALDISGSMGGKTQYIAGLFAAVLAKTNNCDLIRFDSTASYFNVNPLDSVLTITKQISDSRGGTNFHEIFNTATAAYDRIIIISDEQGWEGYKTPTTTLASYKRKFNCNPRVYSLDVAGYGDMQFPENDVYAIAGFSEKIFDLMKVLEQDRDALVKKIESIEL